jgi:hypothetical protein
MSTSLRHGLRLISLWLVEWLAMVMPVPLVVICAALQDA